MGRRRRSKDPFHMLRCFSGIEDVQVVSVVRLWFYWQTWTCLEIDRAGCADSKCYALSSAGQHCENLPRACRLGQDHNFLELICDTSASTMFFADRDGFAIQPSSCLPRIVGSDSSLQVPWAKGWEEIVPRTPRLRNRIPVEEVFRRSFLDLCDDWLFSFTIWDHALEALQELNDEDVRGPATSVEDLLDSFLPILSDIVMSQICANIEDLKNSELGIETLFVQSKKAIFETILYDLRFGAYLKEEQIKSRESNGQVQIGGNQEEPRAQAKSGIRTCGGGGSEQQDQLLIGGRPGEGDGQNSSSGGGEGSNKTSGGGGSDEDQFNYRTRATKDYFQTVVSILIEMPAFITPPRNDRNRKMLIKERSALFSADSKLCAHHISYSLAPIEGQQTSSFYHGTRDSFISSFCRRGIEPRKYHTEFLVNPAFYMTNNVQAAYEFPLFNHLTRPREDPVVLFHFMLDLGVLHGNSCTPSGHRFKVRVFQDEHNDWKKFYEGNMFDEEHSWDIVIGPMCFPSRLRGTVTEREPDLLQIAFCSTTAMEWVNASLVTMFKEKRMNTSI